MIVMSLISLQYLQLNRSMTDVISYIALLTNMADSVSRQLPIPNVIFYYHPQSGIIMFLVMYVCM